MSNPAPQPQQKPPAVDDPLVISSITFVRPVPIGSHGCDDWSLAGVAQNQYHGRSRAEFIPAGVRIAYKSDAYMQITVPWSNLASVTEIALSSLSDTSRKAYERCQREVRR